MALSGTTSFAMTAAEIVQAARSLLGIQSSEEPLQDDELQLGLLFLNVILKAWQADGIRTWTLTEGVITMVQGQLSYSFGAGGDDTTLPFDMDDVRIFRQDYELPMWQMSRMEYYSMPNKTNQGYPTQYYYNRQRDTAQIFVWPAPDSTPSELRFTYRRVIQDIDEPNNNLDLPQEWYQALIYGLAVELIPQYGKADSGNAKLVVAKFAQVYQVLKNFDTGEGMGSITVRPTRFHRSGGWRG